MRAFVRYLFRPRFSVMEVVLLVGAALAVTRGQYLVATLAISGGVVCSWTGYQIFLDGEKTKSRGVTDRSA